MHQPARQTPHDASGSLAGRPLIARARPASDAELELIPWLGLLDAAALDRVCESLQVVQATPGEFVCKIGRKANFWFGVIDGLLKMSNDSNAGPAITFLGVPPGSWFGEGTLLKKEAYRYNIEALRKSLVAGLAADTFDWLLEHSIPFNRHLMNQLNERLGQFIAAREVDRISDPDVRLARSLAALFNPVLSPRSDTLLRITQQELAYLVGLSRQRVNQGLAVLQSRGLIRVEYGGVRVLGLEGLRTVRGPAQAGAGP